MSSNKTILLLFGWLSGILFSIIGIINFFWGNDPQFGIFILLLSLLFYPPFSDLFTKLTRFTIPNWLKIVVAIFILWASMGVGELPDKVNMMLQWFKNR